MLRKGNSFDRKRSPLDEVPEEETKRRRKNWCVCYKQDYCRDFSAYSRTFFLYALLSFTYSYSLAEDVGNTLAASGFAGLFGFGSFSRL